MAKLRITYVKSAIGYSQDQKDTVRSLGLRKLNSVAVHNDTPAIRGMAFKVRHLVTLEEVGDDTPAPESRRWATRKLEAEQPAAAPKRATRKLPADEPAPERATLAPPAKSNVVAEPTEEAAPDKNVAAEPAEQVAPAKADELEVIEGIGPKIAGVLRAAGITTFAQLADTTAERLTEILQEAEVRLADPSTWPEQAALAAAGKWDELTTLTGQLKGGRRA
jgi:ribosomal protein L30